MSERPDLVLVPGDGSIRVVGRDAALRLRDRAGRYLLVADAPGLLVLRREPPEEEGALAPGGTRVAMAGELLTPMAVLEIINIIANAGWRGELHLLDGRFHRVLAIDQGSLKYASSDHPDDRLGQVLYRNGVLSRSQLDTVLGEVGPDRRLGQLLLDKGVLTQESLFSQLQKQIEHVFFASLLMREGTYVFSVPDDESAEPPAHSVHLPVQALLMEGVQRIDEMALFRERIPRDDVCPEVQPKAGECTLDESAQLFIAYADGSRTLEDISRETGLGQFMTLKTVYGLLQQGALKLRSRASVDERAAREVVRRFNEVLRDIFMAVATYGGIDQTRSTIDAWIQGSGYAPILARVEEDGSIDASTVLEGLRNIDIPEPMRGLHQGLQQLASFALFAATTTLPRDQEISLSRDVNSRLKKIRL